MCLCVCQVPIVLLGKPLYHIFAYFPPPLPSPLPRYPLHALPSTMSKYLGSVARLDAGVMRDDLFCVERYIARGTSAAPADEVRPETQKRADVWTAGQQALRARYAELEEEAKGQDAVDIEVEEVRLRQSGGKRSVHAAGVRVAAQSTQRADAVPPKKPHIIDLIQGKLRAELIAEMHCEATEYEQRQQAAEMDL